MASAKKLKDKPPRDNPESGKVRQHTDAARPRATRSATETTQRFNRSAKIDRAKIDVAKRTVEMAFSSEEPVERWGENEILGHADGEYDFTRLNSDHPLLLGHNECDPTTQIGVVEAGSAKVGPDKVGRCTVRFSKSDLGEQIFQDVQDGIRKLVSVGYDRDSIVSSEKTEDGMKNVRYRWTPTHVAIVPVPGDYKKSGIGRAKKREDETAEDILYCTACGGEHKKSELDESFRCENCRSKPAEVDISKLITGATDEQKNLMRTLLDKSPEAAGGGSTATAEADALKRGRETGQQAERDRIGEIEATADALKPEWTKHSGDIDTMKRAAIKDGKSANEFSRELFAKLPEWRAENPVTMAGMGFSERDQKAYSFGRALRSAVNKNQTGATPDGLEGEVHEEIYKRMSKSCSPQGFLIPFDRPVHAEIGRRAGAARYARAANDLQSGIFGQGGAAIQTDIYLPVIELLRNKMVTERLGVRTISGLEGNIAWPRQVAKAGPLFVPETFALNVTNPLLDQVLATPHRIGVTGAVSKQLILQTALDAENWLREDQLLSLAVEVDRVTLLGQGANSEPTGIFNTVGIGSVNFGGAVTYQKVVNFKTQLALANALAEGMAYVTTPGVEEKWRTTPKVGTTFPIFIWEDGSWGDDTADGRVVGLRATATNQITNDRVGFGNFMDACKLMWGGLDILVNPYTRSKEAVVEITTNAFMDVLVRHQGSFAYSVDAGDQ